MQAQEGDAIRLEM